MVRIPYVEKENAAPEVAELYAKMESRGFPIQNLWKMAAHCPAALGHMIRLGDAVLLKTRLNPTLREIAILRSAVILDCAYETKAHTGMGKQAGVTDEQIQAVKDWKISRAFNKTEQAVLRFTDEITREAKVSDETFTNLQQYLDADMMVELAITIGFYGMLARVLLPFQVDPQEISQSTGQNLLNRSRGQ